MNVHHAEQAAALREMGVTRIIASRDIPLHVIGEIGRAAGVEVECFAHGDMCVAQSGQCTMSGMVFGKSANRGQCMKPCRWSYDLIRLGEDAVSTPLSRASAGDQGSVFRRQLPNCSAGVCALKIERCATRLLAPAV